MRSRRYGSAGRDRCRCHASGDRDPGDSRFSGRWAASGEPASCRRTCRPVRAWRTGRGDSDAPRGPKGGRVIGCGGGGAPWSAPWPSAARAVRQRAGDRVPAGRCGADAALACSAELSALALPLVVQERGVRVPGRVPSSGGAPCSRARCWPLFVAAPASHGRSDTRAAENPTPPLHTYFHSDPQNALSLGLNTASFLPTDGADLV